MSEMMLDTVDNTTVDSQFELCPKFEKTFSILGKKWNGLIIDVLLEDGPQRFKNLARRIPKCSDRVLVVRLKELEANGIVSRVTHCDSALIEYRLTDKGADLRQVMTTVHNWSDKWYSPSQSC
ncbi:winged helix-turn-helix transcriptional regulator [Lactiplantibacillus fabifermentans]|uniref:MarR family transcriptional regulator n=2 Tax=Lactiplantibacillus fabifermentans TaxID=483011 RepID=A0A0R2NPX1_9LACO|nr:helix-turn-helix domain-containing protein [Lactiplantibacillus fabifermentans]ETY74488.1 HxlR family transcriptional regulator [Lactiplantibacillus fabifermentans T30PCM01]KRO27766.1 MarR family transcriptional regulator [Lactiplantibacillus fabifermentans DSM 21115]